MPPPYDIVGALEARSVDGAADYLLQDAAEEIRSLRERGATAEAAFEIYRRTLKAEWLAVGGTIDGTFYSHPLIPGFIGDSRSCWRPLIQFLKAEIRRLSGDNLKAEER